MKTSDWLKKYNILLKKKYGQNFLSNDVYPKKIVETAQISKEETVIEIGAGAGTLTEELSLSAGKIIAYEIDETLKELLNERFKDSSNVEIRFIDFLKADLREFNDGRPLKYVANIPYNISSPIFQRIFTDTPGFISAIMMVQKEFGDRIVSKSGKDYSPLSIFVQSYCNVEQAINIPKSAFIPSPKIDSVVLKLTPHNKYDVNKKEFSRFVHTAFAQRRKNIKNNLKPIISNIDEFLNEAGLTVNTRAEEISVDKYIEIFKLYKCKYCQ